MGTLSTGVVSIQPTQFVTVKQEFECAYFLESEDKKVDINAHRYRIEVSVRRTGGVYNRIVEFSELQNLLKSVLPDRKYLYTDDPGTVSYIIGQLLETKDVSKSAVKLKFELCAENLCNWIVNELQSKLDLQYGKKLEVTDAVLRENSQCYVNWHKVDSK